MSILWLRFFGVIFGATITPIWGWVVAFLTVISLNFNGGGIIYAVEEYSVVY